MPVNKINNTDCFSVSPSIALGNGIGAGTSFSASFSDGHFSFSGGVGVTYYGNYSGLGISGAEFRKSLQASWDDGGKGLTLGTNFWSGSSDLSTFKQQTGKLGFRSGDFGLTYENDGSPFQKKWLLGGILGDGGDRYRSAAMSISVGDYSTTFNIFTGNRDYNSEEDVTPSKGFFGRLLGSVPKGENGGYGANLPYGSVNEVGPKYRLGLGYLSYKGFRLGGNSYRYIGHPIQNIGAHYYAQPQQGFISTSNSFSPYFSYKSPNQFTLW